MFNELKILELSNVLAGPAVGMFFAELGAKVIKVENKLSNGDITRNWKLPKEKKEDLSAYFCSVNYNKKHVFLDFNIASDKLKSSSSSISTVAYPSSSKNPILPSPP